MLSADDSWLFSSTDLDEQTKAAWEQQKYQYGSMRSSHQILLWKMYVRINTARLLKRTAIIGADGNTPTSVNDTWMEKMKLILQNCSNMYLKSCLCFDRKSM